MRRFYLSAAEQHEAKMIIQDETGYIIKSTSTLRQIFTRSSFAAEKGRKSNEIFEFIGDQVLSYYVVKIVSEKCGAFNLTGDYTFRIGENQFTHIKQALVNNETLAKIIDEWDVAKYMILSSSDIRNEVVKETKVKADLFEAIIGAIAIESDWNTKVLETAVSKALKIEEKIESMIENDTKVRLFDIENAVNILKELAESGQCTMPIYDFYGPDAIGYDSNGNPKWACTCSIVNDATGIIKNVYAMSKKAAKKAAAYLVLCEHLGMQNKYGNNDWYVSWTYKDDKLISNRHSENKA